MNLTRTFNWATPVGGLVAMLILGVILLLAGWALSGLGFRFDPFDLVEKRAVQAEASADHSQRDAGARRIEAAGEVETRQRVEQVQIRIAAAAEIPAAFRLETPDDDPPLEPDAVRRLRRADEQLCAIPGAACALASRAAPAVHAGDGADAVPGRDAAG